jgi:hypothetical protein
MRVEDETPHHATHSHNDKTMVRYHSIGGHETHTVSFRYQNHKMPITITLRVNP